MHGNEGSLRARAALVQRPRHQLLAGAAFPLDQHRGPRGRRLPDGVEHLLHGRGCPQNVLEPVLRIQLRLQPLVLRAHLPLRQRALQQQLEAVQVHGLGQEIVGAALHGFHGRLNIAVGRQ